MECLSSTLVLTLNTLYLTQAEILLFVLPHSIRTIGIHGNGSEKKRIPQIVIKI